MANNDSGRMVGVDGNIFRSLDDKIEEMRQQEKEARVAIQMLKDKEDEIRKATEEARKATEDLKRQIERATSAARRPQSRHERANETAGKGAAFLGGVGTIIGSVGGPVGAATGAVVGGSVGAGLGYAWEYGADFYVNQPKRYKYPLFHPMDPYHENIRARKPQSDKYMSPGSWLGVEDIDGLDDWSDFYEEKTSDVIQSLRKMKKEGGSHLKQFVSYNSDLGDKSGEVYDRVLLGSNNLNLGLASDYNSVLDNTLLLSASQEALGNTSTSVMDNMLSNILGFSQGSTTYLGQAGISAQNLGSDIGGMYTLIAERSVGASDVFNSALGSMGQVTNNMFQGLEQTTNRVIQGLINGDINDLDEAWDALAKGMEGVWQTALNNMLGQFSNWAASLVTDFAQAGLGDLFAGLFGGQGGNLGKLFGGGQGGGLLGDVLGGIGGIFGGGDSAFSDFFAALDMGDTFSEAWDAADLFSFDDIWGGVSSGAGGLLGGIFGQAAGGLLGDEYEGVAKKAGEYGGKKAVSYAMDYFGGGAAAASSQVAALNSIAAEMATTYGVTSEAATWAAINVEMEAGGMNLGSLAALVSPAGAMAAAMAPGVIGSLISQYNLFGIGNSPKSRADVRGEVDYAQSQVQAYASGAGYMQGAEYGGRAQDAAKALMYGPQIEGEYSVEEWQAITDSIDALGQKFLESGQKALEFDGSVTSLFERMAASEGSMSMHGQEAMAYTQEIEDLTASLGFSGEAALQFQTELEALRQSYALGGEEEMLFNDRMDLFVENTLRAADNTGLLKGLVDELSASLGLGSEQSLRLGAAVNELFTGIKGQGGDLSDFEDQITELASAFGLGSKETELLRDQLQELSTKALADAENGIFGVQTAVDDMNRKFGSGAEVMGDFSDTIDGLHSRVDVLGASLDELPDDIDIEVGLTPKPGRNQLGVSIHGQQIDLNWMHGGGLVGQPERYHAGDLIRSLAHDEVPIIAQRGEFMIRASSVNAHTLPTLRAINGGAMATAPAQAPVVNLHVEIHGNLLGSEDNMEDLARLIEGRLRDLQNSRWAA